MKSSFVVLFLVTLQCISFGQQSLSADELLKKSINYHDPESQLLSSQLTFDFIETRPNGKDRSTTILCNIKEETFSSLGGRDSLFIDASYNKGVVKYKVNGSEEISEEVRKSNKLTDQRLTMLRNYYQYLWLLPIKLQDEGTHVHEEIKRKDFFGKDALEMKVTYDPAVGDDIWYFYFHPEKYALIGYRFYHDEAANDGEYILLEGEVSAGKVRIPKERQWYMHKDDKFLGADILDGFLVE